MDFSLINWIEFETKIFFYYLVALRRFRRGNSFRQHWRWVHVLLFRPVSNHGWLNYSYPLINNEIAQGGLVNQLFWWRVDWARGLCLLQDLWFTLGPGEPIIPGAPGSPGAPGVPGNPGCPASPVCPASPGGPERPSIPGKPVGPDQNKPIDYIKSWLKKDFWLNIKLWKTN